MKEMFKKIFFALFDNSPKHFRDNKNFNIEGFLENAQKVTTAYNQVIDRFNLINKKISNAEYDILKRYKDFMEDIYLHCNPYNNIINQTMIYKLSETMQWSLEKIENKNLTEIQRLKQLEIINTQIEDIKMKTSYFVNKERESIYKDMETMRKYYSYKRRFISFIRFCIIYLAIILIVKVSLNAFTHYFIEPYAISRWLRTHLWY